MKKHPFDIGDKVWYHGVHGSFETTIVHIDYSRVSIKAPERHGYVGEYDILIHDKSHSIGFIKEPNDILKDML
jgi:hypothetical protein